MTLGKMLRLMAGSVGLRFIGAGLGLMTQLVLAHNFTPADVAIIFLTMSWFAVLGLFLSVGYPLLAFTQLPRYFATGRNRPVRAFHGAYLRDTAIVLILGTAAVAFLCWTVIVDRGQRLALTFGGLAAVNGAFLRYNASLANSLRRFNMAFAPDFIFRQGSFFLVIVITFLAGLKLPLIGVLALFVACGTAVTVGQHLILRRESFRFADWKSARPRFTRTLRRRAMALVVVGAVTVMFADILTLFGGLILSYDDTAVLGLAVRIAALAGFVTQATQQFILPDLTAALAKKHDDTANDLLTRLSVLTVITLAGGLVFSIFFGGFLLGLFGEHYARGHLLLVLLMFGQSIRALGGINQSLLSIGGHQLSAARACFSALALLLGIWLILNRQLGLNAAGYAVIAAEIAWALVLGAQAQSLLGRRADLFWLYAKA